MGTPACDFAELTDDIIDITFEHTMRITSPQTTFPIWQLGGAVARVRNDETPSNGRAAGHTFNVASAMETAEGFERERSRGVLVGARATPHERVRQLPHRGRGRSGSGRPTGPRSTPS